MRGHYWYEDSVCFKEQPDPKIFEGRRMPRQATNFSQAAELCDRCPVTAKCLSDVLSSPPITEPGQMGAERGPVFPLFQAGMTPAELTTLYGRTSRRRAS